jgi:UDP-2-acetamido-2-deoxy-ribo-hexuluronate aminotransferase
MKFIDLSTQYQRIQDNIDTAIKKVLNHGQYIMGPEVFELEEQLAEYIGVRHCISCSSGTDALLMALMALEVGRGDEVITTAFSFFATAEVICLLGAKPVFVDIDPDTYNIDASKIEEAITPKTKAIMPVSLYGQCADYSLINRIAEKHNLPVIEDGAQSFGATHHGKKSCGLTTIGCTSFFPSKPLGAYGDGGACFTEDDELAKILRSLRVHGQEGRYNHVRIGINGRLDTIQAAILIEKLKVFDSEIDARTAVAMRYSTFFQNQNNRFKLQAITSENTSVYAQFTLQHSQREEIIKQLSEHSIPTAIHYPHTLPISVNSNTLSQFNNANKASKEVFSLPMHPYLTNDHIETIANLVLFSTS